MELEELSQRLNSLEQARADELQKAAQQAFMNKYGSRISNNDSLGLVILNELNRRGVDTSAADEAVSSILDQLRMEATMLLDTIKEDMNQASQLVDKIDAMDESVQAAAVASGSDMSDASAQMQPESMPQMENLPTETEGPGAVAQENMPSVEAPIEQEQAPLPPEYNEMPDEYAAEEPQVAPEGLAENQMVSDANQKEIVHPNRLLLSDIRQKVISHFKSAKRPTQYVPSAGVLAACKGE